MAVLHSIDVRFEMTERYESIKAVCVKRLLRIQTDESVT